MRLKGLGQLKNPVNSSRIEPTNFRLVAYLIRVYIVTYISIDGVLEWMIGFIATYTFIRLGTTSNAALSLTTHFTVHLCTRARVLSLH
jgi:hypothetical protein